MRTEDLLASRPGLQYAIYRSAAILRHISGVFGPASRARIGGEEPILMVLGAGRSGNTLLRRSLMERGRIYIPPESYVFSSQAYSFLLSGSLDWPQQVGLVLSRLEYSPEYETFPVASLREFALEASQWPIEKRNIGDLICSLYRWLGDCAGVGAERVGDKTPMNLARIGLISRMFPQASYVYIERDPVEVAYSYRRSGLYPTLEQGALRWKRSREAWLRFRRGLQPSKYIEIRFEDLLESHVPTTEAVLNRFGIALRAQPIDVLRALGDVNARSHHAEVRGGGIKIRRSVRAELSSGERLALRSILGEVMRTAGYEAI